MTYTLIDSGNEQKLERFGAFTLIRPCPQAIWHPRHPEEWKQADASFSRDKEGGWQYVRKLPASWNIEIGGIRLTIAPTEFGHLGVFPEHAALWMNAQSMIHPGMRILNLFAYSGGATLAFAEKGASVCHVDASKGMVDWARKNAALNQLDQKPIRWIVDDVMKFMKREVKRKSFYDAILLDPPSFGRGNQGEVFKIERDFMPLLELCQNILSDEKKFLIVSCHTPLLSPLVLRHTVGQVFGESHIEAGEMALSSPGALDIPSGSFAVKKYG